ncbi:hypothetical protein AOLI_G00288650 [Acnodon oligacanthus]
MVTHHYSCSTTHLHSAPFTTYQRQSRRRAEVTGAVVGQSKRPESFPSANRSRRAPRIGQRGGTLGAAERWTCADGREKWRRVPLRAERSAAVSETKRCFSRGITGLIHCPIG